MEEFETYIEAQKMVAYQFVITGIGLLVLAAICHFFGDSSLSKGLKTGALFCGLFILIGGIAYLNTEKKLLQTQTSLYQKNKIEFQQVETERMQNVIKAYPMYQYVGGTFIILSLLVVFFIKNPFWHGVAFAVLIYSVVFMLIEAYSHLSIKSYFTYLTN